MQPLLAILAGLFIALLVANQWPEIRAHDWQLAPRWLVASALLLLAAWAVEVAFWRGILHALGGRLPYLPAVRIWFLSAIVRYIPGGVWQPLSMTLYAQQQRVRPEITLTSVVLYQGLSLLAATPLAAVYFWATNNWGLLTGALGSFSLPLALLLLLPLALFLLWPDLLVQVLNRLLRALGRPPLAATLQRRVLALLLLVGAIDWLLWGASFAALIFGLNAYTPAEQAALLPHLVVSFAIATSIGYVAVFVPSGLGVREGSLYILLAPLLGGGAATVSALAMRLWTVLGEVILALLSALTMPRAPSPPRAPSAPVVPQAAPHQEPG